ncbi:LCP family protein, partial [Patescibacteria group bacterium]|nr:LCP family protein [Patescibacteria group bacterium]
LLDFRGFKKAIDLVGGIDVEVENTFDDYKYPIEDEDGIPVSEGELYEHIHFEKGMQVMDGETALKYARSRNSTDEIEGGDDARSRRQQKTIIAFKDKVLKFQTLMKTDNLKGFLKIFQEHVAVNLSSGDILSLSKLLPKVLKIKAFSAYSLTSDYKGEEILVSPLISKYGQWVLEPRTGDWRETRDFVLDILK